MLKKQCEILTILLQYLLRLWQYKICISRYKSYSLVEKYLYK